jgi:5'-methylthioadenosine nucleosidase
MSVQTIAVIIAMEAEAMPLVEHLGLKKVEPSPFAGPLPAVCYSGAVNGAAVHVCTNGKSPAFGVDCVGTVPAALTAYGILQAVATLVHFSAQLKPCLKRIRILHTLNTP